MERQNIKINGVNTKAYGVLSERTPVIMLPKDNYQRINIPGRITPQYQKSTDKTTGHMTLELNGIFKDIAERVRFETDIIHAVINQPINKIEFETSLGIEYHCLLADQIGLEELFDDELIVKYTLGFSIELFIKK